MYSLQASQLYTAMFLRGVLLYVVSYIKWEVLEKIIIIIIIIIIL